MGDVPEVANRKFERGLTVKIDDELDDPPAKEKTGHEENDGEGVEAKNQAVLASSQGRADKSEKVVTQEGEGEDQADQQAGIDSQIDELVRRGEHEVDVVHFE